MLENLYGSLGDEAKIVACALKAASTRETAHPDDRAGWSEYNPSYGQCDLYTDFCRRIWGRDLKGHWNNEAKILVWWVYSDKLAWEKGIRKNKLTVHYSFKHAEYGLIDLAHDQFPDKTFLYPRPEPLSHSVPVSKSWNRLSEMGYRRGLIEPKFVDNLLMIGLPERITPELCRFLEETLKTG